MKILRLFLTLAFIVLIFGCVRKTSDQEEAIRVPKIPNNSVLIEKWAANIEQSVSIYSWKKDGHSYLIFLMNGYESRAMQVVEVKQ